MVRLLISALARDVGSQRVLPCSVGRATPKWEVLWLMARGSLLASPGTQGQVYRNSNLVNTRYPVRCPYSEKALK